MNDSQIQNRKKHTKAPTRKAPMKYGGVDMWNSSSVNCKAKSPDTMSNIPKHICNNETIPYACLTNFLDATENRNTCVY
jgi:hypothetical protein